MAEHIAVDSYDLDFEPIDLDEIVREIMQPMMDMTSAEFQHYVEERQRIKASMLPEERVSAAAYQGNPAAATCSGKVGNLQT